MPTPAPRLNTTNPAAAATQYWSDGLFGVNSLNGIGYCTYLNARILLRLATHPPVVYAHDDHPGAGNDTAQVRYSTYVVNAQTGNTVSTHGFSEFATATDTVPATFAYGQSLEQVPDRDFSWVLDVRVEWWSATAMTGAAAHRVPSYYYYVGGAGPIGPIDSCAVVYNP